MRKSRPRSPVTTALDRGPARYFHGRKQILRDFSEIAAEAVQWKGGTTFLIQGAPGAGKTALLTECERMAQKRGWETTEISSSALWDPDALQQSLKLRRTWTLDEGAARVGVPWIGEAEISAGRAPQTVETLLRRGKRPLLLTLDEAHVLGKEKLIPPDHLHTVVNVLNAIHNGRLTRPVIFIAAGVGTTFDAFSSLGVSRFEGRCLVRLGALGKEAEQAILRDWLTKEGQAKGDPAAWIDAIAQEAHGWPQHILSYVDPALKQLGAARGEMTAEGLYAVLEAGRAKRGAYYEQRVRGFDEEYRQTFARLFVDLPLGGSITSNAIRAALTQDYGAEEAKRLFRSALDCGMLHKRSGRYTVPIPSMQDWLVSNYTRAREKGMASRLIAEGRETRAPALPPEPSRDTQEPGSRRDFGR